MFPEDPKDLELGEEAEELLSHWPLSEKSPAEWDELAARIDARIKITELGSTPDYLLDAPIFEEQDVQRRSHPRMKRPSAGSLAALAKASLATPGAADAVHSEDTEREALARSLLSLAVKARAETQDSGTAQQRSPETEQRSPGGYSSDSAQSSSAVLSGLVNGPSMQFLAARQAPATSAEPPIASAVAVVSEATSPKPGSSLSSKSERGMWFGIAFGLLGMAAAGVMYITSTQHSAPAASAIAMADGATARTAAAEPATPVPPDPTPAGALVNIEEVPLAEAAPAPLATLPKAALPKDAALARHPAAAARPSTRAPAAAAPSPAAAADTPASAAPPAGPSEPGMMMADSHSSLPDHPSSGAVQAAVGTVMGAARACVAGQSAASRATVSFGSDGKVQSVAVAGPAQGTNAEPCLRNALSGARVQPFARAAYSVNLTVRPQ